MQEESWVRWEDLTRGVLGMVHGFGDDTLRGTV